jgi:hypothetical protein
MKTFYDEHAAVLWRYALRLTGDASQAEDVVQETLLRACWAPTGSEYEVALGDCPETTTAIPAAVIAHYLMTVGDGVR